MPENGKPACCYSCKTALIPVFDFTDSAEALAHEQWGNALILVFEGGYGMFIDPMPDDEKPDPSQGTLQQAGAYKIVLCHDCAHALCETVPWITQLLRPLESHSHRRDQDHGDHAGWDLPHVENAK